jgi:hypothetical protein
LWDADTPRGSAQNPKETVKSEAEISASETNMETLLETKSSELLTSTQASIVQQFAFGFANKMSHRRDATSSVT